MLCLYFSYTFQVDSAALPTSAEYLRGLLVRCSPGKLPQAPPLGSTATTVGRSLVVPSPLSSSLAPYYYFLHLHYCKLTSPLLP